MYAKIALMGFDVHYGKVSASHLPGLTKVEPFHKVEDPKRVFHVGPGAVFRIDEMSQEDAAKAWCGREHINLVDMAGTAILLWAEKEVPVPAPVEPLPDSDDSPENLPEADINGHHFDEGRRYCGNTRCNVRRDLADAYPCPDDSVPF